MSDQQETGRGNKFQSTTGPTTRGQSKQSKSQLKDSTIKSIMAETSQQAAQLAKLQELTQNRVNAILKQEQLPEEVKNEDEIARAQILKDIQQQLINQNQNLKMEDEQNNQANNNGGNARNYDQIVKDKLKAIFSSQKLADYKGLLNTNDYETDQYGFRTYKGDAKQRMMNKRINVFNSKNPQTLNNYAASLFNRDNIQPNTEIINQLQAIDGRRNLLINDTGTLFDSSKREFTNWKKLRLDKNLRATPLTLYLKKYSQYMRAKQALIKYIAKNKSIAQAIEKQQQPGYIQARQYQALKALLAKAQKDGMTIDQYLVQRGANLLQKQREFKLKRDNLIDNFNSDKMADQLLNGLKVRQALTGLKK